MASRDLNQNFHTSGQRLVAFFQDQGDAYSAISELKDAGFTTDEIGLMAQGNASSSTTMDRDSSRSKDIGDDNESFWDKVKHFFSGDSSDDDIDYRGASEGMNWERGRADYYYRGVSQGGALVSVTGPRIEEARRILENAGGDLRESGFTSDNLQSDRTIGTSDTNLDAEQRIRLRGEVLRTYRERVQQGEVTLRKEVVTENQTVEVPVTREELVIERVPVSGEQSGEVGKIGSDREIRVPLSEERARVEKQPVVNEEVRVGKRAVQSTERLSDDVRHEELRVDKDPNVQVDTRNTGKNKKPAA